MTPTGTIGARRQVFTGRSALTPLGLSVSDQVPDTPGWRFDTVIDVTAADASDHVSRTLPESFTIKDYVKAVGLVRKERFSHLAIAAAVSAHADCRLTDDADLDRIGIVLGTEYGPQRVVAAYLAGLVGGGLTKARPGLFTQTVYNVANGQAALALGFRGVNSTLVGGSSVAYASHLVSVGKADVVFALSVDETNQIMDEHLAAIAPRITGRRLPLVTGEAAAGIVIEAEEHARTRGATVIGSLLATAQASAEGVMTSYEEWSPTDDTLAYTMRAALDTAGVDVGEVDLAVGVGNGFPGLTASELSGLDAIGYTGPIVYPRVAVGECFGGNEALACVLALEVAAAGATVLVNCTTVNGGVTTILLQKAEA